MGGVRVYVPSTLGALAASGANADERRDPAVTPVDVGSAAYAVTPALREWYRDGDLDELEYVALGHAARASLLLLAGEGAGGQARRVVLAADVPDASVSPAAGAGVAGEYDVAAVRLGVPITVSMLAAVHVDDPTVCDEVAAAATAMVALTADPGDDDARFAVDSLDDHELQWYAVQELPFLLS